MSFAKFSVFWEWRIVKSKKYPIRFDVDITELAFKLLCMIDIDKYIQQSEAANEEGLKLMAEISVTEYGQVMGIQDFSLAGEQLSMAAKQLLDAHVWVENDFTTGRGFIKFIDEYSIYIEDEPQFIQIMPSIPGRCWLSENKKWFYDQYVELASAWFVKTTSIIKRFLDDSNE